MRTAASHEGLLVLKCSSDIHPHDTRIPRRETLVVYPKRKRPLRRIGVTKVKSLEEIGEVTPLGTCCRNLTDTGGGRASLFYLSFVTSSANALLCEGISL